MKLSKPLPKWPALLVIGSPVSKEDAARIIIRTQNFWFSTNNHKFQRELEEILDIPKEINYKENLSDQQHNDRKVRWDKIDKTFEKYKCIRLEYLQNHQICSSYIGGPHGWCNWNGNIFTNSYNIGKWPSCEQVYQEWQEIAKAFPFLNLKSQLFSGEQCESGITALIQFNVANGIVEVQEPEPLGSSYNDIEDNMFNLFSEDREIGCTVEKFKWALKVCGGEAS